MTMYNADGSEMTTEQIADNYRQRRNKFLTIHVDTINAVRWSTFTDEQKLAWQQYREDLLNLPQQEGFPENVVFPTKPV
jgi:5-methylthioribose kinase